MSNVFFQPFVGKDYAKGGIFGKCIMILGESHYCEGCLDCGIQLKHPECMDFTQGVLVGCHRCAVSLSQANSLTAVGKQSMLSTRADATG